MAGIQYWLWLRNLRGIGNQMCLHLLDHFGTPENIYYADPEEYRHVEGLTKPQFAALEEKDFSRAEEILEACARLGIRILTLSDAEYPDRLRAIPNAPCVLYVKGTLPDFDREAAVAMIGTRKATGYSYRVGEPLSYELAKGGAYIVSGMAAGGDALAHRGALLAGCKTAAVLGGGVDVVYPAQNRSLYEDILVNGVILSEYPPGTEPKGAHFLERNRIISGLSVAVVVVEAGLRSGTMNTVHHALDQGRDVYAVPGPVDAPYSQGCNRLIQEGAKAVTGAWDILEDLQLLFPERIRSDIFPVPPSVGREPKEKDAKAGTAAGAKKAETAAEKEPPLETVELSDGRFTDDQIRILSNLSDHPMAVDDIAELVQIPVRRVLSALTVLEIEHLVKQESGSRYILNATIRH